MQWAGQTDIAGEARIGRRERQIAVVPFTLIWTAAGRLLLFWCTGSAPTFLTSRRDLQSEATMRHTLVLPAV